jgi:hypothetical protein
MSLVKERTQEPWSFIWMDTMSQDVRGALRGRTK